MKTVRLSVAAVILSVTASCSGNLSPSRSSTPTLASFTTGTWYLKVDRAWDGTTGAPQFPSDALDEAAYKAVSTPRVYRVVVSDGGQLVTLRITDADTTLQAQRAKVTATVLQYDLPFTGLSAGGTGGRFLVWSTANGLQAELTLYGSGVPITQSERGVLLSAQ